MPSQKKKKAWSKLTGDGRVGLQPARKSHFTYPHFWMYKGDINIPPQLQKGTLMWDEPSATRWWGYITSCWVVCVMPRLDRTNKMNYFYISSKPEYIQNKWNEPVSLTKTLGQVTSVLDYLKTYLQTTYLVIMRNCLQGLESHPCIQYHLRLWCPLLYISK